MPDKYEEMKKVAVQELRQVISNAENANTDPNTAKAKVLGWVHKTVEDYGGRYDRSALEEILEVTEFLVCNYPMPEITNDVNVAIGKIENHMKTWSEKMDEDALGKKGEFAKDNEFEEKAVAVLGDVVMRWEETLERVVLNRLDQYAESDYYSEEIGRNAKAIAKMIKAAKEAEFKNSLILDAFRALQKIDVDFVNDEDWQIWRTWFKRIDPEETEASE
jgi:enolase